MQPQELQAHLQKTHGLLPGIIFDPYAHEEIPSLCFGRFDVEMDNLGGRPLVPQCLRVAYNWSDWTSHNE